MAGFTASVAFVVLLLATVALAHCELAPVGRPDGGEAVHSEAGMVHSGPGMQDDGTHVEPLTEPATRSSGKIQVGDRWYTTIAGGLAAALPGDTMVIGPGTYKETVTVEVEDMIIEAGTGGDVIIDGDRDDASVITIDAPGVTIRTLVVERSGGAGRNAGVKTTPRAHNATIWGVVSRDNSFGGIIVGGNDSMVEGCVVSGNGMSGISVDGNNTTVRGCHSRDNGVGINVRSGGNRIVSNNIFNSGSYAIHLGAPGNFVHWNNITLAPDSGPPIFAVDGNDVDDNPVHGGVGKSDGDSGEETDYDDDDSYDMWRDPLIVGAFAVLGIIGAYLMIVRPMLRARGLMGGRSGGASCATPRTDRKRTGAGSGDDRDGRRGRGPRSGRRSGGKRKRGRGPRGGRRGGKKGKKNDRSSS